MLVTQLISLAARLVAVGEPHADAAGRAPRARRAHASSPRLIEMRDAAGARQLMDDHVKMIRARRVAEHAQTHEDRSLLLKKHERRTPWPSTNSSSSRTSACRNGSPRRRATSAPKGSTTNSSETVQSTDGKAHAPGRQGRRDAVVREGPQVRRQLRLPLDRERRGRRTATASFTAMPIRSRRAACSCRRIRQIKTPEDLAGVPISVGYQSGSHYATIQALEQYMPLEQDQPVVQGRHAVQPHGAAARRQGAGLHAVQRAVLLRRAARLPQGDRHAPS